MWVARRIDADMRHAKLRLATRQITACLTRYATRVAQGMHGPNALR